MTRPLVLLHGFTGSPESWAEVRRILGAGEAGERAGPRSPTSPMSPTSGGGGGEWPIPGLGHDGTRGSPGVHGFNDEVDRLATIIRKHDLSGAHLTGYSMGGRLALGLLIRHPDLFTSGTLIGASPGLSDPAEREARVARDEEWARLLDGRGLDTFVAAWEALPIFATQADLDPDILAGQDRIRRSHDAAGLARSLRVVGLGRMPDYRPELGKIEVPVRLVVGERDEKFRRLAEEMAERLPRANISVVSDAGHNVVLERPERIAALLREDMTA